MHLQQCVVFALPRDSTQTHVSVIKKHQLESLLLSLSLSLSSYLIMLAKPTELLRRLLSFAVYRASSKHKDVVYKTLRSLLWSMYCVDRSIPLRISIWDSTNART